MFVENEVREACLKYFGGDVLATDVWMKKYCLRGSEGEYLEKTPDDMHRRLAKEFARIEGKYPYPLSEDEIYEHLKNFKYIVPQGSPMSGIGNDEKLQSLSNCVVIAPPEDSISGIMESAKELANLFKMRSGVGIDISTLRPDGSPVNNSAGTSTGAWSFADFYSYVTRMIGQGGRRGASIITMSVNHPDILKFITMKHDLTKVTGANISVRLTDEFMEAVDTDKNFILRFPCDIPANEKMDMTPNKTYTFDDGIRIKIRAKDIWDEIVNSATTTAEPGILFWDQIKRRLPADNYPNFNTSSCNPCAELPLSNHDSCRLITINLKHFVEKPFSENPSFDIEKFRDVVKVATRLSDDLVDLELEKIDKIIEKSEGAERDLWIKMRQTASDGRRTGLGTHGLADCLSRLKIKYGDQLDVVDKIYQTLRDVCYDTSVELAVERGTFPVYDLQYETSEFLKDLGADVQLRMKKHGRRNISLLTNAPTGSVSILSQTSSGIEPVFKNSYKRRRKISEFEADENSFKSADGEFFQEYEIFHHNIKEYFDSHGIEDELPEYFVEAGEVDPEKRVMLQSCIQASIDHSLSSTLNLPKGTSSEVVGKIYMDSWKKKLKGVTVYVDGCREGVLVGSDKKADVFVERSYVVRDEILECDIHHRNVDGNPFVVLVGLKDGRPYEVFAGKESRISIPKKYENGKIRKKEWKTKNNRYDLMYDEDGMIKDIVNVFDNPDNSTLGRMISLSLRYGARVSHVVEQLQQTHEDSTMNCFSRVIARVLKTYIEDGTKPDSGKVCTSCGEDALVYQDGCVVCMNCGWSRCM